MSNVVVLGREKNPAALLPWGGGSGGGQNRYLTAYGIAQHGREAKHNTTAAHRRNVNCVTIRTFNLPPTFGQIPFLQVDAPKTSRSTFFDLRYTSQRSPPSFTLLAAAASRTPLLGADFLHGVNAVSFSLSFNTSAEHALLAYVTPMACSSSSSLRRRRTQLSTLAALFFSRNIRSGGGGGSGGGGRSLKSSRTLASSARCEARCSSRGNHDASRCSLRRRRRPGLPIAGGGSINNMVSSSADTGRRIRDDAAIRCYYEAVHLRSAVAAV